MNELTELQKQVFERAREQLKQKDWFRGVCMDDFPSDFDIQRDGVETSATHVMLATAYWDCPDPFNP